MHGRREGVFYMLQTYGYWKEEGKASRADAIVDRAMEPQGGPEGSL